MKLFKFLDWHSRFNVAELIVVVGSVVLASDVVSAQPVFNAQITSDSECEYHAPESGLNQETLTIGNSGDETLIGSITVTAGSSWLSVAPEGAYSILSGGPNWEVTVTMDASSLVEDFYNGTIEVTHNDTTLPNPQVFQIEFFVVNDFYCGETQILKTGVQSPGVLALEVGSDGRVGTDPEGGLWRAMDSSLSILDATLAIAHGIQGPDTVVFHRFYNRTPEDPGQRGFRALADLDIDTSAYGTGQGVAKAVTTMATKDSLLQVDAGWFFPQHPDSSDFVIMQYTVTNRTDQLFPGHPNFIQTIDDIVIGFWADFNVVEASHLSVQEGFDNDGAYRFDSNFVYQYGRDTAFHDIGGNHLFSSKRYSGGVTYMYGRNGGGGNEIIYNTQPIHFGIDDNRKNSEGGGPTSGLLYENLIGLGSSIFGQVVDPDSNGTSDLFTFVTLDQGLSLAPGESQTYVIGLLSDTLGHFDYPNPAPDAGITTLHETLQKCWGFAQNNGFPIGLVCVCGVPGDATGDGSIGVFDAVSAVNVAFRSGSPTFDPDCPHPRQDYNCDSLVDVRDVRGIAIAAFGGGFPTCDPCTCVTISGGCSHPETMGGSVVIESKTVSPGDQNVAVGVYIENTTDLSAIVLPLEFRSISGGAFVVDSVRGTIQGRVGLSGLSIAAGSQYADTPVPGNPYSGPVSQTYVGGSATPTGSPYGAMSVVYEVHGPCLSTGSDGAPGSGTPSYELKFNVGSLSGQFEIDSCCFSPANHLMFVECNSDNTIIPTFTKGVITVGTPPDCTDLSFSDPYLLACPKGDIAFTVHLRDQFNQPMIGYSDVTLDFSDCDTTVFIPQPGLYPDWPIVTASSPSDSDGVITFTIAAGGNCSDCDVTVTAGCGFTTTVPARSVDVNGDGCVTPEDHDDGLGLCRDLNADGVVDDRDAERHNLHCCDHCFPLGPCDYISQEMTLDPDFGFSPDDTVRIYWSAENNVDGSVCQVDSVVLFESDQSVNLNWNRIDQIDFSQTLSPGGSLEDTSLTFEVPNYRDVCLQARLYSDCCDTFNVATTCRTTSRQCPPADFCFVFYVKSLADADLISPQTTGDPFLAIWDVSVKDTVIDTLGPDPVTQIRICTSEDSPVGTSGTVTINYKIDGFWKPPFIYNITQEYFRGDLCGGTGGVPDCQTDVFDVVCLVDFVFRSGPPILPMAHMDINCDEFIADVLDVVRLVDFIFRSGPQPDDCGAGPGPN